MSVGPTGIVGSLAGTSLPQSRGTEADRAQQETSIQQRKSDGQQQAEMASGIGETSEDQESSERDADGRRLWEKAAESSDQESAESDSPPPSLDASGHRGLNLDLRG